MKKHNNKKKVGKQFSNCTPRIYKIKLEQVVRRTLNTYIEVGDRESIEGAWHRHKAELGYLDEFLSVDPKITVSLLPGGREVRSLNGQPNDYLPIGSEKGCDVVERVCWRLAAEKLEDALYEQCSCGECTPCFAVEHKLTWVVCGECNKVLSRKVQYR